MTQLLDANVLVALAREEHSEHARARRWWGTRHEPPFATCPITQGALVGLFLLSGVGVTVARGALQLICQLPGHEFWPDDLGYADVDLSRVIGHRQVTDAYLAALARLHGGTLVTFDRGLAALHPDVVTLLDP